MYEDAEPLLFRRQFLLGPRPFLPAPGWRTIQLRPDAHLSVHPDLDLVVGRSLHTVVVLLGQLIDPLRPEVQPAQLVQEFASSDPSLTTLLDATDRMSGRWALLLRTGDEFLIFNDPCALRQVYFSVRHDGMWCGSQPEIIRANCPLERDQDPRLREFLEWKVRLSREGAWIGNRTEYADCLHLLPNHYLDLNTGRTIRFFPRKPVAAYSSHEAIEATAALLRGTLAALVRRGPIMLPVTAGRDSRILLAAARDHLDSIYCYVDRKGVLRADDPDVQVPLRLSEKLGFKFTIENSIEDPSAHFMELLRRNVTGARLLPKTRAIYAKLQRQESRVNVNGNAGGLARHQYDRSGRREDARLTPEAMAELYGYGASHFARSELGTWLQELGAQRRDWRVLDLMYWEQRMGNWGAQYPAEQDIAVDEVTPFNNRMVITMLLGVPAKHRIYPDYSLYSGLLEHLWPQALSETFNPRPKVSIQRASVLIKSVFRRERLVRLFKRMPLT